MARPKTKVSSFIGIKTTKKLPFHMLVVDTCRRRGWALPKLHAEFNKYEDEKKSHYNKVYRYVNLISCISRTKVPALAKALGLSVETALVAYDQEARNRKAAKVGKRPEYEPVGAKLTPDETRLISSYRRIDPSLKGTLRKLVKDLASLRK